ncbi:hypothetical protein OKW49_008216 [Paraburkholderia youngii]
MERAAQVQLKAMSASRPLKPIPHDIAQRPYEQMHVDDGESARTRLASGIRELRSKAVSRRAPSLRHSADAVFTAHVCDAPARVTSVLFLSPPVSLIWAWAMFREPLSWLMALGTVSPRPSGDARQQDRRGEHRDSGKRRHNSRTLVAGVRRAHANTLSADVIGITLDAEIRIEAI